MLSIFEALLLYYMVIATDLISTIDIYHLGEIHKGHSYLLVAHKVSHSWLLMIDLEFKWILNDVPKGFRSQRELYLQVILVPSRI